MQIKALKTFRQGTSNVRRGATVDVADAQAKELVKAGLAEEVKSKAASEPAKGAQNTKGK